MVGRHENPVDPGAGAVQRFAFGLRKLPQEAEGITYRVTAEQAGYSVSVLSRVAAGEQLPTLPAVVAYVRACGGGAGEWERRLYEVAAQVASELRADGDADAPYAGLAGFELADRDRFFDRDRLIANLLELVGRSRFTAAFGPSGSGKSSLLQGRADPGPAAHQRPSSAGWSTVAPHPWRTAGAYPWPVAYPEGH
jgi:hypothetical protein